MNIIRELHEEDELDDIVLVLHAPKRYIRDMTNPMNFYSNREFKKRYRFEKQTIMQSILPIIERDFHRDNHRGLPFPPILC